MRAPVTVVTATIPGRERVLGKCLRSVYLQTIEPECHIVMAQSCTEGIPGPLHCAMQQNVALSAVTTEWTMRLADDDQLLPHHLAAVMGHDADVIYTWDASGNRPRRDCNGWSQSRLVDEMEHMNWIDGSAVAIRTDLLRQVGGWPTDWVGPGIFDGGHYDGMSANADDWACFVHLARAGARFLCIPEESWLYGSGSDNEGTWTRMSEGG